MFTGSPVVASDFPELRNIVMDAQCGVLVDSTNPESIAEGIKSLLRDPVHAKQMGKNGKAAMEEKYGYHVDLQNLETFYHTISDK
jgi:glycosyltransferase involved in cell wall biosynthesis